MSNTTIIPVSLPKELARDLDRVAKKERMTRSEYVREALRRRLAFADLRDFQKEFSKRARKAGVRTFQDAVHLVNEVRHGKSR